MVISASNNSSSKKRKIWRKEDDEVEEDQEREEEDEAKMETFFALVRNIRETRDRWINSRSGDDSKNKRMCKNIAGKCEENRVAALWKPTFQLEDFAEEKAQQCQNPRHHPSLPLLAGKSQSNNSAKEDDAEKGIDLRLSLWYTELATYRTATAFPIKVIMTSCVLLVHIVIDAQKPDKAISMSN